MSMSLYEMTEQARFLYSLLENEQIDEQTVADTLEGIGVEEKLESYIYIQKQFEADLSNFKAEKERIEKRLKTCQSAIDRMKAAVMAFMSATGTKKARAGTFDLSIRATESVNIVDESKIPNEWLIPQAPKVNKVEIKKALKAGKQVAGAEIIKKDSLMVR